MAHLVSEIALTPALSRRSGRGREITIVRRHSSNVGARLFLVLDFSGLQYLSHALSLTFADAIVIFHLTFVGFRHFRRHPRRAAGPRMAFAQQPAGGGVGRVYRVVGFALPADHH